MQGHATPCLDPCIAPCPCMPVHFPVLTWGRGGRKLLLLWRLRLLLLLGWRWRRGCLLAALLFSWGRCRGCLLVLLLFGWGRGRGWGGGRAVAAAQAPEAAADLRAAQLVQTTAALVAAVGGRQHAQRGQRACTTAERK